MNKVNYSPKIAAVGLSTVLGMTGAICANAQTTDAARDVANDQSDTQSVGNAANSEPVARAPGTVNPVPATRQAEGTAADNSPPGQTRVRGTAASQAPAQATAQGSEQGKRAEKQHAPASESTAPTTANPIPATRQAEGTAADNTMPGGTPVRGAAAAQAPDKPTAQQGSAQNEHSIENELRQSPKQAQSSSKQTSGAKSGAGTQSATRLAVAEETARRGSTMIGAVVKDAQGQHAGTVQDIIVDTNSGRVTHAVVAPNDPAESLVAIPWRTVQSMHRGGALVVDRDRLASAPKFDSSKWPDLTRAGWSQQADQHWSAPMSGIVEQNQREYGTHGR